MNVFLELSKIMPTELAGYFADILPFIKKCFEGDISSQLQIPGLLCLQYLLTHGDPNGFKAYIADLHFIITQGIKCDHFSIICEALSTVSPFISVLTLGGTPAQSKSLFDAVLLRLVQNDIE